MCAHAFLWIDTIVVAQTRRKRGRTLVRAPLLLTCSSAACSRFGGRPCPLDAAAWEPAGEKKQVSVLPVRVGPLCVVVGQQGTGKTPVCCDGGQRMHARAVCASKCVAARAIRAARSPLAVRPPSLPACWRRHQSGVFCLQRHLPGGQGPEAGGSAWVPQTHQRRRPTTPVSSDRCVRNPRQRRRCPEGGPFRRMQAIPPNPHRAFDRHKCLLQFWAAGRDHRAEDTRAKKHRKRGPDGGDRWPDDWPRNPPSLQGASPPRSINRLTSI